MSVVDWLVGGWALLALGVTLTAFVRVRSPRRRVRLPRGIVVLRPVDAPSPVELANLSTPLPPGVRQLVLSPYRLRLPVHAEWLPSDPPSKNRKLGHLRYALEVLRREAVEEGREEPTQIVIVDADVRIDEALLAGLVGELDAGADVAWAAPRPELAGPVRGLLVQSLHAFDALEAISGEPRAICGKALGLGPLGLELLRSLPDCVGEDLELAIRLHRRDGVVRLAAHAHTPGSTGLLAAHARFTRWMQVLRAHRPRLFPTVPVFFACTPMLLAAAAFVAPLVVVMVGALVVGRTALAMRLERLDGRRRWAGWWLAGEALLLAAWLGAVVRGGRVEWRGRALTLGAGGVLASARVPLEARS